MLRRLRTAENEVSDAEQRLLAARWALTGQAARTREAVKTRLGRPDALLTSAGLGALYGLWVTRERPADDDDDASPSARAAAGALSSVPGWIVRAGLSMMVSHFMSGAGAGAGHADAGAAAGIDP